jgi:hypothetical protein
MGAWVLAWDILDGDKIVTYVDEGGSRDKLDKVGRDWCERLPLSRSEATPEKAAR